MVHHRLRVDIVKVAFARTGSDTGAGDMGLETACGHEIRVEWKQLKTMEYGVHGCAITIE